jgi:hypothetical protein
MTVHPREAKYRVTDGSCVSRRGTNFAATRLMFKSTVKIRWQELQLTPVASEISSIVYRRSLLIFSRIFRHSRRNDLLTDAQNEDDFQRSFLLFCTTQTTRKLVYGSVLPFMCFCGRISETEIKSQAHSLFGTVRHHDFAREAWQHLGELTTQARTTFYGDVRYATDSWRVQLRSPCGGTLNYD